MIKQKKTLYLVVTADDTELPVFCGTVEEVAEYFHCSISEVYCKVTRGAKSRSGHKVIAARVWEDSEGGLYDYEGSIQSIPESRDALTTGDNS